MSNPKKDIHDNDTPQMSIGCRIWGKLGIVIFVGFVMILLAITLEPLGPLIVVAWIVVPIAGVIWIAKSERIGGC